MVGGQIDNIVNKQGIDAIEKMYDSKDDKYVFSIHMNCGARVFFDIKHKESADDVYKLILRWMSGEVFSATYDTGAPKGHHILQIDLR